MKRIHKNVTNKSFQKDWGLENIYLWRKVVCLFVLFCLYLWDPPNQDASDRVLGLFGKLSARRAAWAWFHDFWTCSAKVLEYWMISSLKIKLNHSWKFRRNSNVPLVLLERSWWAGFNGIYLARFGFRMWEILNFKWSLHLNKFSYCRNERHPQRLFYTYPRCNEDKSFNHIYMVILWNIAPRAHDASGWTRYYKQASKQANITV